MNSNVPGRCLVPRALALHSWAEPHIGQVQWRGSNKKLFFQIIWYFKDASKWLSWGGLRTLWDSLKFNTMLSRWEIQWWGSTVPFSTEGARPGLLSPALAFIRVWGSLEGGGGALLASPYSWSQQKTHIFAQNLTLRAYWVGPFGSGTPSSFCFCFPLNPASALKTQNTTRMMES